MLALNKYTDNLAEQFLVLLDKEDLTELEVYTLQQKAFNNLLEAETQKIKTEFNIASLESAILGDVMSNKSLTNETMRKAAKLELERDNLTLQNFQQELIDIKLKVKSLEFLNSQIRTIFTSQTF